MREVDLIHSLVHPSDVRLSEGLMRMAADFRHGEGARNICAAEDGRKNGVGARRTHYLFSKARGENRGPPVGPRQAHVAGITKKV